MVFNFLCVFLLSKRNNDYPQAVFKGFFCYKCLKVKLLSVALCLKPQIFAKMFDIKLGVYLFFWIQLNARHFHVFNLWLLTQVKKRTGKKAEPQLVVIYEYRQFTDLNMRYAPCWLELWDMSHALKIHSRNHVDPRKWFATHFTELMRWPLFWPAPMWFKGVKATGNEQILLLPLSLIFLMAWIETLFCAGICLFGNVTWVQVFLCPPCLWDPPRSHWSRKPRQSCCARHEKLYWLSLKQGKTEMRRVKMQKS